MKILITGGAGFIGSNVVKLALERGHKVVNVDLLTYASCLTNLTQVESSSNYSFENIDIRDFIATTHIFTKHQPDAVMHLAAETHVDRSIDDPSQFIETNILGTYNILEASRKYWIKRDQPEYFRFHHVSTDEVFGSLTDPIAKFTETTPYDPRNPYSASKAASDHLVRAWYETYRLPVVLSNCSNNYGPYHFPDKLIPIIIVNALAGKPLPIYGDGSHVRDWIYVEDHARALMLVLTKGQLGRSYLVGGENGLTNLQIVTKICCILDRLAPNSTGSYTRLITYVRDRPGHDKRYAIDASRIRNELNWSTFVSIEEGLERTVRWYIENENWWGPLLIRENLSKRLGTIDVPLAL